jgi:hypothetical protein
MTFNPVDPICLPLASMVVRLDDDLNLVARVVELLIVLDVPTPDITVTVRNGEAELTLGQLELDGSALGLFARRLRQTAGSRSVEVRIC